MASTTFTFNALPKNTDELQALPEAALSTPFATAALTVCALCRYPESRDDSIAMLNFLRGPRPLTGYDTQFIRDRFMDKKYVPISYFAGTSPQNNYTPTQPYRITISENPYSYAEDGYAKLFITSSGADSPRSVMLRRKGEQWFLWEQYILSGIRIPAAEDPWA